MSDQFGDLLDGDVSQRLKLCTPGEPEADSSDVLKILQFFLAPDLPEIPSWEQGLKIAFYIPPILVDVVGNSLVILIVALNKKMRTTTNLLILNLSVSDIMVACFCMWIHLATQLQQGNLWPFGAFLCKVTSFVQVTSLTSSVLTLTIISLERFLAIVFPLRQKMSHRAVIVAITCTWIVSAGTAFPYLLVKKQTEHQFKDVLRSRCREKWPSYNTGLGEDGSCKTDEPGKKLYYTLTLIIMYVIPILVMGITYTIITVTLINRKGPGGKSTSSVDRARKKVIRMLIVVLVSFVICWTPQWVFLMYDAHYPPTGDTQRPPYFVALKYVALYIAYSNSAINPVMYAGFNENFRRGFLDVFRCRIWNKKNRIHSDIGNSTVARGSMRHRGGVMSGKTAVTTVQTTMEENAHVYGSTND
ncbi:allatostatin-A receptor-like isoform X2 [Ostrea edulis]|uniref:allatostatin-A receptor-like isoform X2 n=1 Tax=Ostrea edulis TaxID=37623 RepID=UPI002095F52F|nr:allatostatin-A receptor-like isoform X2 [Ostrea edulis]